MITLLQLYLSFCKIGFTSFGGLSMIPLINSEMASHSWMTLSEISDIVAIAEMTPGPLGLNCATFAGIRVAGTLGAIAANFGILTPTFTICAVAAVFFEHFKSSSILERIMTGVRPVGIGLVWAVILNLSMTNYFPDYRLQILPLIIGLVALFLLLKKKMSIPKVIIICALMGLIT